MDDQERDQRIRELADTLEITIEAVGEMLENQTRQERQIINIAKVTQRLLELQRFEYQQLNGRISKLEDDE